MSSLHERTTSDEGLSIEDKAAIANQRRVWEVRKYCQTRPSLARGGISSSTTSDDGASLHSEQDSADGALTALLRGTLTLLEADIVMVSLLDEHTQFFLSGATPNDSNDGWVSAGSAQWYGCDEVNHHGGLCERTISGIHQPGIPALYEVLDMSRTERTQNLPFINGTVAEFRHYAGMPIRSPNGLNIGTVFTMSKTPATTGINQAQRDCLYQATKNVMAQLVQATQALEGKRAERYNEALSRLLNSRAYDRVRQHEDGNPGPETPLHTADVYRDAAKLLHEHFEFSGLVFQEVPLAPEHSHNTSTPLEERVIANEVYPGMAAIVPLQRNAVHDMLEAFPNGGVLHIDDAEERPIFAGAVNYDKTALNEATNVSLAQSFPGARQIMFTPLWDAVHNRVTALCVGWVLSDLRVLRPETDLMAMSSFCMATMSLVLRMESQMLERVKSDFLGSISHETRSPLHGILGNLELALMTDCSSDLRKMLLDARSGASQLLETLDKVLLHSRVQGQSKSTSTGQPLHLVTDGSTPEQDKSEGRGSIVQIGPRSGEYDATSGETNLIDLCEEIIESVAKHARFSERTTTPSVERKRSINDQYGLHNESSTAQRGGWDGLVIFDGRSSDNRQVRRNTPFRAILENLLGNAIKFTRSKFCVRASLRLEDDCFYLDIIDCGRGFSKAFVRHSLYVPFSQQEPLDSGVGLGLSLVKGNLDALGGHMQLETDETLGSTATISIPVPNLIGDVEQKPEDDSTGRGGTSVIPPMPRCEEGELPVLRACIYAPKIGEDKRGKRSISLLHESLSHTLEAWFQPRIALWQEGQDESLPHLVFIAYPDLESFRISSGEAFTAVKKVVVCADVDDESEYDGRKISAASRVADAIITGSILPSKLWKAIMLFFPHIDPTQALKHEQNDTHLGTNAQGDRNGDEAAHNPDSKSETPPDEAQIDHDDKSRNASLPDRTVNPVENGCQHSEGDGEDKSSKAQEATRAASDQISKEQHASDQDTRRPSQENSGLVARPRLLLVDDNNVNLKMLAMFVKKCGIAADDVAQASGGQQAIDLYREAATGENGPAAGFDIIFMDLSMPEVNGFDATSAIRRMEEFSGGKRSYIAALTGLVSDKDRHAANVAGTDEYITKPAGLKNVKAVIDKWKSALETSLLPDGQGTV